MRSSLSYGHTISKIYISVCCQQRSSVEALHLEVCPCLLSLEVSVGRSRRSRQQWLLSLKRPVCSITRLSSRLISPPDTPPRAPIRLERYSQLLSSLSFAPVLAREFSHFAESSFTVIVAKATAPLDLRPPSHKILPIPCCCYYLVFKRPAFSRTL